MANDNNILPSMILIYEDHNISLSTDESISEIWIKVLDLKFLFEYDIKCFTKFVKGSVKECDKCITSIRNNLDDNVYLFINEKGLRSLTYSNERAEQFLNEFESKARFWRREYDKKCIEKSVRLYYDKLLEDARQHSVDLSDIILNERQLRYDNDTRLKKEKSDLSRENTKLTIELVKERLERMSIEKKINEINIRVDTVSKEQRLLKDFIRPDKLYEEHIIL